MDEAIDADAVVVALHEVYGWPLVAVNGDHGLAALAVRRPDGLLDLGRGIDGAVAEGGLRSILNETGEEDEGEEYTLEATSVQAAMGDGDLAFAVISATQSLVRGPVGPTRVLEGYEARWPRKTVRPGDEVLVIVHPGSALGSADANLGRENAKLAREGLEGDLKAAEGHVIIIHGDLSDELDGYPELDRPLRAAALRAARGGHLSVEMFGQDMDEANQQEAARRLVGRFPGLAEANIVCTGAWATDDNSSGCVNSVADVFRAWGCGSVTVSRNAVYEVVEADDPYDVRYGG